MNLNLRVCGVGRAWTGYGKYVAQVWITTDGGAQWRRARLTQNVHPSVFHEDHSAGALLDDDNNYNTDSSDSMTPKASFPSQLPFDQFAWSGWAVEWTVREAVSYR